MNFADIPGLTNSDDNFGVYYMYYRQILEDGILLGLLRYRFLSKFFNLLFFLGMPNLFSSISMETT